MTQTKLMKIMGALIMVIGVGNLLLAFVDDDPILMLVHAVLGFAFVLIGLAVQVVVDGYYND